MGFGNAKDAQTWFDTIVFAPKHQGDLQLVGGVPASLPAPGSTNKGKTVYLNLDFNWGDFSSTPTTAAGGTYNYLAFMNKYLLLESNELGQLGALVIFTNCSTRTRFRSRSTTSLAEQRRLPTMTISSNSALDACHLNHRVSIRLASLISVVLAAVGIAAAQPAPTFCAFEVKVVTPVGLPAAGLSVAMVREDNKKPLSTVTTGSDGVVRFCDAPVVSVHITVASTPCGATTVGPARAEWPDTQRLDCSKSHKVRGVHSRAAVLGAVENLRRIGPAHPGSSIRYEGPRGAGIGCERSARETLSFYQEDGEVRWGRRQGRL